MDSGLAGQAVLITGASGSLGSSMARAFAAEGTRLGLHYFRRNAPVEDLAAEAGTDAVPLRADLRREDEVAAMFDHAVEALGRLDAVVVNAGIWEARPAPVHEMSLGQWQETLDTDLTAAFLTCRGFLRHLASAPRETASIVLVGSTAGMFGEEGHADYAAAKAGLIWGLTLSLKNEIVRLAPRGRVNCVAPGWVATPMAAPALADAATAARATATIALGKVATPEDVARATVFLTSHRLAGHVSGAVLPVTGGMEGRLLHPPPDPA